jgi:DNA-binding NarL/FixJ family response regulator
VYTYRDITLPLASNCHETIPQDIMARIFIVDDHPTLLEMLRMLLESEPGFEVCGEASSGEEALEKLDSVNADVALLDVSLPQMSGIELGAEIKARFPDLPFLMFSGHGEKSHVRKAVSVGARGYVLKMDWEEFPAAIRHVLEGQTYLSESVRSENVFPADAPL